MQCICSVAASLKVLSCRSAMCEMQASIDGLLEAYGHSCRLSSLHMPPGWVADC